MAFQSINPPFVLVPLMTKGHMIDFARLLAPHGVKITLVIAPSPTNAHRFSSVLGRSIDSGLGIQVTKLVFLVTKAGLPDGCENLDMVPSPEELFTEIEHRQQCVIPDLFLAFTYDVAHKFWVLMIVFNVTGCFYLLSMHCGHTSGVREKASSDIEKFAIPGLPNEIEFTRLQTLSCSNIAASYGVAVNSFRELKSVYLKVYKEVVRDKVRDIGLISSYNKEYVDRIWNECRRIHG